MIESQEAKTMSGLLNDGERLDGIVLGGLTLLYCAAISNHNQQI